jgi:microsomal dipeptidase-like Zn-dependent dipeptidase
VRVLALCGDDDNPICDSAHASKDPGDRGLSDFGRRVVAECNRLGLTIDPANCSERSLFDVLGSSAAPVILSQCSAGGLAGGPGAFGDEGVRAVAAKGGAVLVSFALERPGSEGRRSRGAAAGVADDIERVIAIGGGEGVGFCSGTGRRGGAGRRGAGELLGLTVELLRRGFNEVAVESIWGANIMRVFQRVEEAAASIQKRGS